MQNHRMLVLDWGIGGLPLLMRLRAARPDAELIYLSDAGYQPYGRVGPAELGARLDAIAGFASRSGATAVAVACNAMSSVLQAPVTIGPGGVALLSLVHSYLGSPLPSGRTIAVIGGNRIIDSGLYRRGLEAAGNRVLENKAQPLSALIEAGDRGALPPALRTILAPLAASDALVLACTHYPAAAPEIAALRPDLELIDPLGPLEARCLSALDSPGRTEPERSASRSAGALRLWTTGDPEASRRGAAAAFGFTDLRFETLPLGLTP